MQKIEVRRPPIGAVLSQHKQGVRGSCGWCGKQVEEKTPARGWFKYWHGACELEMGVITQPGIARDAVVGRDKGVCCDCGEDWSEMYRLVPEYRERDTGDARITWIVDADNRRGYSTYSSERWGGFPFIELRAVSLWHVDHKVPLWKVAHMPPLQRLEYFKLGNLITRCHRCHGFKTSDEAADRSKFNAQAAPAEDKAKSKWQGRGFQKRPPGTGNGFPPKGSTPMRKK